MIDLLHSKIAAVCPIDGITMGHELATDAEGNPVRGAPFTRIEFRPEATPEQRASAEAVLATYDPVEVERLRAARAYIAQHLPPGIRGSMNSYWISILGKDDAELKEDCRKLHMIDMWETSVLGAGSGDLPPPPEWLADFLKDF